MCGRLLRAVLNRSLILLFIASLLSSSLIANTKGSANVTNTKELKGHSDLFQGNGTRNSTEKGHDLVKRSPQYVYHKGYGYVLDRSSSMEYAEPRGHDEHYGGGWGWDQHHHHPPYYHHGHKDNHDAYALVGGLSLAGLLGAAIILLARRNTSGRRRRSLDSIFEDEEETTERLVLDAIEYPKY